MVIALLVMILLMGFVALAISRTNSETVASANDAAESRAFDASHACLEVMTRNFNKIFETKLNPDTADLARVKGQTPPGFTPEYDFTGQDIVITSTPESVILTEGQFQGLTALRDGWRLICPAVNANNGVQVTLNRRFFNNRIPIFQFGIFYDDDLEFHPGPRFDFGGRVHSNGNLFLQASNRLNFSSKVTAHKEIFTDIAKNGTLWTNWNDEVYIKDASGVYQQLDSDDGSVLNTVVNGAPVTSSPLPTAYTNANWPVSQAEFQGNLLSDQKLLQLPLKINSQISGTNLGLIEIVKRGKKVGDLYNDGTGTVAAPNIVPVTNLSKDDLVTASERYYNKTGIRVHLADSKAKLPGCADNAGNPVTTPCGVRLDGESTGTGADPGVGVARGYRPYPMTGTGTYNATRVNGERFFVPDVVGGTTATRKQVWIKVETVAYNATTQNHDTVDITHDILSLGVTEQAPAGVITDTDYTTGTNGTDGRSIIKLQRFVIPGAVVPNSHGLAVPNNYTTVSGTNNYVVAGRVPNSAGNTCVTSGTFTPRNAGTYAPNGFTAESRAHTRTSNTIGSNGTNFGCIVPFPINMFDTREGLFNDTAAVFNPGTFYGTGNVPWAGVMSVVDIDVANLKRFMDGNFDGGAGQPALATGTPFATAAGRPLRSTDIPNAGGIVFYVSDRRGDFDFDGEYDMEDIFGNNDGNLQPGEDVNQNGTLQAEYVNEAPRYNQFESADRTAVFEHKYYRRAVRLINGQQLPGRYDTVTPANSRGFTVASENGVYVQGNYNATGVLSYGTPTPSTDYLPQNTVNHIPASVAADAVVILSNNWQDGRSFAFPFALGSRTATETFMRFAILTGDSLSSLNATPNQGGGDPRLSGGVHNFKRFLEAWGGRRMNYSGSLINLFNSHNNNGAFKCCNNVYGPPDRNWVFDTTFLDINRIPPGTPFFQSIQITGFERRN